MQWSERPPATRSRPASLRDLHSGRSALSVAVAHFILVRSMRVSATAVLAAVLLLCLAPVAAARSRCDTAFRNVEAVLDAYEKAHPVKLYPKTLEELQSFAARRGAPLDLAPFSEFTYKRSREECSILYTCRDTGLGGAWGRARITVH